MTLKKTTATWQLSSILLILFVFISFSSDAQKPLEIVKGCHEEGANKELLTICDLKYLINNCANLIGKKMRSNGVRNYTKESYDKFSVAINEARTKLRSLDSLDVDYKILSITYSDLLLAQSTFSSSFDGNSLFRFVGTGDIQKSLAEDSEVPANAGFGVTYERDLGAGKSLFSRLSVEASINVATSVDSLRAEFDNNQIFLNQTDFGNSLLIPINSGQAAYFNLTLFFNWNQFKPEKNTGVPGILSGLNVNIIASNRNWEFGSDVKKMTAMSFRIGGFKEFFPFFQRDPNYSITFGVNWQHNHLLGDAALNEEIRMNVLGTDQRGFNGVELTAGIRLKNLKGEIAIPFFKKKNDISIEGLTGGRLITRIRFTGGFPVNLDRKEPNPNL